MPVVHTRAPSSGVKRSQAEMKILRTSPAPARRHIVAIATAACAALALSPACSTTTQRVSGLVTFGSSFAALSTSNGVLTCNSPSNPGCERNAAPIVFGVVAGIAAVVWTVVTVTCWDPLD